MMDSADSEEAHRRLNWPVSSRDYEAIRHLWLQHWIAEEKREIEGLVETVTPACIYQVVPTGQRWEGHDGARAFYASLFGAFPDVRFSLNEIVIGPQGVFEVARLTGTHEGVWAGIAPTGRHVALTIAIYFPWSPEYHLFEGEKVFFDRGEMDELLLG
ncbi:MAG: ester cyclase [Anaerolineae bacterium]